jgi:hypothetical protein
VCDAIAAGDPELARAASRSHLASVVDNFAVATEHDPVLQRRISAFMGSTDGSDQTATAR